MLPNDVSPSEPEAGAPPTLGSFLMTRSSTVDSVLLTRHGRRRIIVYIEDNPSNVALMNDLLADYDGVVLSTAATAEIGIELVRSLHPDIVIMDINLPGMSGLEATQVLAASPETRDIPVIALTAGPMLRDTASVRRAGFYRYLTKPVKVDELTSVLEELLTATADTR
jgi:CheY-like chemotaxis protein